MKTLFIVILGLLPILALSAGPRVPIASSQAPAQELSTQLPGLDSLDVETVAPDAKDEHGVRRDRLESNVFRRETAVRYVASGRDPFRALISDDKKGTEIVTDLLVMTGAVLTGVVWSEGQYLAMIKNKEGKTFFLHDGDTVYQGRVMSVTQSQVVVDVSDFGDYQRITLKVKG